MILHELAALMSIGAIQDVELTSTVPQVLTIESANPMRTASWTQTVDGHFVVWARSETVDPVVHVQGPDRVDVRDDNGGGGTTACVVIRASAASRWSVNVSAASGDGVGDVVLHLSEVPEPDAVREFHRRAQEALRSTAALFATGPLGKDPGSLFKVLNALNRVPMAEGLVASAGTRTHVEAAIANVKDAERSGLLGAVRRARDETHAVVELLESESEVVKQAIETLDLAREIQRQSLLLSSPDTSIRAAALAEHAMVAKLPPEHPLLRQVRDRMASALFDMGQIAEAIELREKIAEQDKVAAPSDKKLALSNSINLSSWRKRQQHVSGAGAEVDGGPGVSDQLDRVLMADPERRALMLRWYAAAARAYPPEHETLRSWRRYVVHLFELVGDQGTSRALLAEESLAMQRRSGRRPSDSVETRVGLARAMVEVGDLDAARREIDSVCRVPENSRYSTLGSRRECQITLADILLRLGQAERAAQELEWVLEQPKESEREADLAGFRAKSLMVRALGATERDKEVERWLDTMRAEIKLFKGTARFLSRFLFAETLLHRGLDQEAATVMRDSLSVSDALDSTGDRFSSFGNLLLLAFEQMGGNQSRVAQLHTQLESIDRDRFRRAIALRSIPAAVAESNWHHSRAELQINRALDAKFEAKSVAASAMELIEVARSIPLRTSRTLRVVGSANAELDPLGDTGSCVRRLLSKDVNLDGAIEQILERDLEISEHAKALVGAAETQPYFEYPSVDRLASALPAGGVAIVYVEVDRIKPSVRRTDGSDRRGGETRFVALILRRNATVQLIDLGDAAVVTQRVDAWKDAIVSALRGRAVIESGDNRTFVAGAALRKQVFDPIREQLSGDERHLVIVLDGALHEVPLESLPLDEGMVADKFSIELRSCLTERILPSSTEPQGGFLGFGGIDYDAEQLAVDVTRTPRGGYLLPQSLPRLRHSLREVDEIKAIFDRSGSRDASGLVMSGSEATVEELFDRAPEARFLHLATHGLISGLRTSAPKGTGDGAWLGTALGYLRQSIHDRDPMMLCGIALAGANSGRVSSLAPVGIVSAYDLAAVRLDGCELAVLSVCNGNVGVVHKGRQIASLQSAMHLAGARSVISSLWSVEDEATQQLMSAFYEHLWVDGDSKSVALRKAKAKLASAVSSNGHPRYEMADWAAWVLTGDPD